VAYNVKWEPGGFGCYTAEQAIAAAIMRAGPAPLGYLYRFTECTYASSDPWGDDDRWTSHTQVELEAFPIRKITPCGWTLDAWTGARHRWVSKETTKRFALPTVEEALASYVARKLKQEAIHLARAAAARRNLETSLGGWAAFS
jgi:hypothetical protein